MRGRPPDFARTQDLLKRQIPGLDGLRGIAIILVLLIHFGGSYPESSATDGVIKTVFLTGWSGVDLFFVLSGFLITGILLESRLAGNYFTSFYARRFLRIFPLYYAFLFGWFFVAPASIDWGGYVPTIYFGVDRQLPYWTYTANWLPLGAEIPLIRHLWSLAVEEQFYLVWPLFVLLFPGRALGFACLAVTATAVLSRVVIVSTGASWFSAYATTPARMDTLALGALVAVALRDEQWHRYVSIAWRPLLAVSAAGAVATALVAGGPDHWNPTVQTAGYTLLALAFASALAGLVLHAAHGRNPVLEASPLRAFGKYSYAIYVFHSPLCFVTLDALNGSSLAPLLANRWYYLGFMILGIATSFVAALLSWNLLEKHVLKLKVHFAPTPARTTAICAPPPEG